MKLLLDEMWPAGIAEQLRNRGHAVVAVVERPDLRGAPDETVFAAAFAEGRAIVTENVIDYRPLAAAELQVGRSHPGLLLTANRTFPRSDPRTAGRLVSALDTLLSSNRSAENTEIWLT